MADMMDKKPALSGLSPGPSQSDFEKGTVETPAADSALLFLRREGDVVVDIDENKLRRKIDLMIIP